MLPAPTFPVATARNPFDSTRVNAWGVEGQTVEEIIVAQGIAITGAYGVRVTVGGELVPERMFARIKPKSGTLLVIRVVPLGGDSGKAVFSIIVGVLTLAAAIFMPAGIMALGMAGMFTAEGAMAASLALSGAMAIGTGIQSLVAPPPAIPFSGEVAQSQDSAALTGARNSARLYGPIRTVLGQYRVYPDIIAKPFAERVGKDSILRLLMGFGYGPLDITDIRIGETPIEELIPSSKYNILQGWDDDPELSIFRDEVDTEAGIQPDLPREDPAVGELTTKADPKEISVDFQFPAGLISFNENSRPIQVAVTFTIEEREQTPGGTATWNPISTPTQGIDVPGSVISDDTGFVEDSAGQFTLTLAERGNVTRGLRWTANTYSDTSIHEIRITRTNTQTTVADGDRIFSDARVLVIRTIRPHVASLIPNLAKIELEINASETGLSGVIDNLSAVCTSILPKWNASTKTWGPTHANASAYEVTMYPTRNAAWQYAQVLRGPANSRPVEDNRIDGSALLSWAANLDGTGSQPISGTAGVARNLDAVVDFTTTTRKLLSDIAGASRGSLSIADGKYSVVQDVKQDAVIQHFTPRNSFGFSGAKSFRRKPHAIRANFVNPDKGYQRDEQIVYADGYSLDGEGSTAAATAFAELSLWGVSDSEQAFRDARYHMKSNILRPEVFTITADVEHIVANRGDLVRISHDVIGTGYGGARLKAVTNSGGSFESATMDEDFDFASGKDYCCRIRTQDGNDLLVNVKNQMGTSNLLEASSAISYGSNSAPAEGDLILFGERGTESLQCIILRISPRNDLTALIELTEYNEDVYDPGDVEPHVSNITLQTHPTILRPVKPEIIGAPISDESALAFSASGTPQIMIVVNVATPIHAEGTYSPTTHFHGQFRMKKEGLAVTDWMNSPRIEAIGDTRLVLGPVEEGEYYDVRIRSISDSTNSSSGWVQASDHKVIGMSTPPDAPTELRIWGDALRWNYGEKPADFAGFIIKTQAGTDATWETGIPLSANLITDNWTMIGGRIQPGPTTIMVRAVDLSGNESTTLSAVKEIRSLDAYPVIGTQTWTGIFSGTKENCAYNSSSGFLEAEEETSLIFWSGGASSTFWTGGNFWGVTIFKAMSFTDTINIWDNVYDSAWPVKDNLPARFSLDDLDIVGADYVVEYRHITDSELIDGYFVNTYSAWTVWPGNRILHELEEELNDLSYEVMQNRVSIAGGSTQGKIKSARLLVEGIPKIHRASAQLIATSGTVISLVGLGWRKITNVTITPTNTADTEQGALIGEAYNLSNAQTTTAPYELNGPTIKLYDTNGDEVEATASVFIEGY